MRGANQLGHCSYVGVLSTILYPLNSGPEDRDLAQVMDAGNFCLHRRAGIEIFTHPN